jgi:hypothetical protein
VVQGWQYHLQHFHHIGEMTSLPASKPYQLGHMLIIYRSTTMSVIWNPALPVEGCVPFLLCTVIVECNHISQLPHLKRLIISRGNKKPASLSINFSTHNEVLWE